LAAGELDEESNRGRDAPIVDRRSPIDDVHDYAWTHRRHGRPQVLFSDHESWESHDHAIEWLVNEHVWVYENTYLRRSTNWMMGTPSVGSNPEISTTSPRRYRHRPSWVVSTSSYRLPTSTSHCDTGQQGSSFTRSTHQLCNGTGRIALADIQKLEDGLATWLELVQLEWVVRRPNPGLRTSVTISTYVCVGTKEPFSLCRNE